MELILDVGFAVGFFPLIGVVCVNVFFGVDRAHDEPEAEDACLAGGDGHTVCPLAEKDFFLRSVFFVVD